VSQADEKAEPAPDRAGANAMIDHLFRSRAGQMVAYMTRLLGPEHLDLAEEVVQEALLKALGNWPYAGIPDNPSGWLFRVARNLAIDAVRHRNIAIEKAEALAAEQIRNFWDSSTADPHIEEQLRDDELRMVLMCCHPAIPPEPRVALSLKTVGGFSTAEIARAFLVDQTAIAQRIVRAKRQLREMGVGFDLPASEELAARLESTLEVLYLMFNEGYTAGSGEDLIRQDLCREALRLARLLAASTVSKPRVHALVALMAFQGARLPARVDASGDPVLLEDQDRQLWDQRLIALGFQHFYQCSEGAEISTYHLEAAIAATHARAPADQSPNWQTILELYDQLLVLNPSPVVALNRVVALAKVQGPGPGLEALARLQDLGEFRSLKTYYLLPAVQGKLLLDLGEKQAAARYFRQALSLPCSEPERRLLGRRLMQCG
jgi:RNA polymerase sigma-70 factor (ECF subfamily)